MEILEIEKCGLAALFEEYRAFSIRKQALFGMFSCEQAVLKGFVTDAVDKDIAIESPISPCARPCFEAIDRGTVLAFFRLDAALAEAEGLGGFFEGGLEGFGVVDLGDDGEVDVAWEKVGVSAVLLGPFGEDAGIDFVEREESMPSGLRDDLFFGVDAGHLGDHGVDPFQIKARDLGECFGLCEQAVGIERAFEGEDRVFVDGLCELGGVAFGGFEQLELRARFGIEREISLHLTALFVEGEARRCPSQGHFSTNRVQV